MDRRNKRGVNGERARRREGGRRVEVGAEEVKAPGVVARYAGCLLMEGVAAEVSPAVVWLRSSRTIVSAELPSIYNGSLGAVVKS